MQEPKIEYPCDYPIKVIGESSPSFLDDVLVIVQKYDSTMALDKVKERASWEGNYKSITLLLWATSEQQIKDVFAELKTCEAVRLVL